MDKIKNYYVLKIDVSALIKSGRDKFYRDPNYALGIWTYENIPPLYIEKIDEIPVNLN
jgi:RNA:NAD 2'-phosphotransferase (TPT1/KptA family)